MAGHPSAQRGIEWLLREQEADGSWFGRWGCNYVYGTGAAVPALVAAGHPARARPDPPRRPLARAGAERRRRLGRGHALLRRPGAGAARGESTASQTAWALLALHAAGERDGEPPSAACAGSARRSCENGTWDEPWYTGTGFPGDFYINYHLYRLVFPVTALARYA